MFVRFIWCAKHCDKLEISDVLSFLTCYFFVSLFVMFIFLLLLLEKPQKNFVVGLKLKGEFKQVYEDLENLETKTLVRDIENNVGALIQIIMINLKLVL